MTIAAFEQYILEEHKQHIIFDFDETLCTLHIDWKKWGDDLEVCIRAYDPNFSMTKVNGLARMQNAYVKKFGKTFRDELVAFNSDAEKKYYSGYSIVPHALDLLHIATRHADVHIWTSNDTSTILPILHELNINHLFKTIVGRNDVAYIKPDPEGFSHIYAPEENISSYLFVGDSTADRDAAASAGIAFIPIQEITQ